MFANNSDRASSPPEVKQIPCKNRNQARSTQCCKAFQCASLDFPVILIKKPVTDTCTITSNLSRAKVFKHLSINQTCHRMVQPSQVVNEYWLSKHSARMSIIWCLNMLNTANGVPRKHTHKAASTKLNKSHQFVSILGLWGHPTLQLVQLQSPIQNLDLLLQCDQEQPRSAHVSWQPFQQSNLSLPTGKGFNQSKPIRKANRTHWFIIVYYNMNKILDKIA